MIGILVDNIANDTFNYCMFRELNRLSKKEQCFVFTNNIEGLPMQNNFAILQQVDALAHQGTLIATNLLNCQVLANSLTAEKKFMYLWSFDWMNFSALEASSLNNMLHNEEIDIITRSKSHEQVVKKMFKAPKGVVYNWRANEILKAIS